MRVLVMQNVRVYFNRRSEFPFVWSIDEGPGTEERTFRSVYFMKGVAGVTTFVPDAGDGSGPRGEDLNAPRAWIHLWGQIELEQIDGQAFLGRMGE